MHRSKNSAGNHNDSTVRPYNDLFIYFFKGRLTFAENILNDEFIDSSLDLVIANIHYDVMKHLITSQGFLKKKWFILSGLLRSQARDIRFRLSRQPVRILKTWEGDGIWHTFFGETR